MSTFRAVPSGSTPGQRLHDAGLTGRTYGESIASGHPTAESVMAGWLSSPGHCRNLMPAGCTRIGIGVATSSTASYSTYWVQDFLG